MGSRLFLVFAWFMAGCSSKSTYTDAAFIGFWAETRWEYVFKPDGTFVFKADGHYSMDQWQGRYIIGDSIIFLDPDTDWPSFDGVLESKLKIIDKDCIRDYSNNIYCKDYMPMKAWYDMVNDWNDKKHDFEANIIALLDGLPIVAIERKRLLKNDSLNNDAEVNIIYNGIVVVDRQEFHRFNLKLYPSGIRGRLDILVRKHPFAVYEHLLTGDSLRPIPIGDSTPLPLTK